MKIYINAAGIVEYVKQIIDDKSDVENRSLFNNSLLKDALLNSVFFKQDITIESSIPISKSKITVDAKDQDFDNERFPDIHCRIMNEINKLPDNSSKKNKLNYYAKEFCLLALNPDNGKNDSSEETPLKREGAISLCLSINSSIQDNSYVNIKTCLSQFFFVSEQEQNLNRSLYTRALKNWEEISKPLCLDEDIIIVDQYFFDNNKDGVEFGKTGIDLLKEILSKCSEKKRRIVVFYQNTIASCWLYSIFLELTSIFKKCSLTFVGVDKKLKLLHDRMIISNHRIIVSGHSFAQYFNGNNTNNFSANGSMYAYIGTTADKNNEAVIENCINYLQEIVNKDQGVYMYGSNESNLLEFGHCHSKRKRYFSKDFCREEFEMLNLYPYGTITSLKEKDGKYYFECYNGKEIYVSDKNPKAKVRLYNIRKSRKEDDYDYTAYCHKCSESEYNVGN